MSRGPKLGELPNNNRRRLPLPFPLPLLSPLLRPLPPPPLLIGTLLGSLPLPLIPTPLPLPPLIPLEIVDLALLFLIWEIGIFGGGVRLLKEDTDAGL